MKLQLTIIADNLDEMNKIIQGLADKKVMIEVPQSRTPEPENGETSGVTIEKIRALMQEKMQKGHKDAIKGILKKFDAANLTFIKPENYEAYYQALDALT